VPLKPQTHPLKLVFLRAFFFLARRHTSRGALPSAAVSYIVRLGLYGANRNRIHAARLNYSFACEPALKV
jgi:hypothetical protein